MNAEIAAVIRRLDSLANEIASNRLPEQNKSISQIMKSELRQLEDLIQKHDKNIKRKGLSG